MSKKNVDISVIIPTYNEMKRKEMMLFHLQSIEDYFINKKLTYELIIVLDGPTDDTPSVIEQFKELNNYLKIINRKFNKGKGYSLREGMTMAKGNIVLFTDMDGSTPIHMLDIFLNEFEKGADVVIGSRKINPEKFIKTHQPRWKERIGEIGNVIIQLFLGLKGLEDTQCGFKAFTKEANKNIIPRTTINRWGIDFEMLVIGKKLGYSVIEVPVEWNDSGNSLVGFTGYINTLFDLLSTKWKLLIGAYNLKKK